MQQSLANTSNESTTKDYAVEQLSSERLKDVEFLYKEVYGRTAPQDYFRIKYDSAYTGHEYMGFIAYNKDHIPVAYYGVVPCFLQCGNERIIAAQSADTMTHPKFRFKGMFVELSNITFDLCRQRGIRVIFGFPNQNSYHGAVHKLGWKMTDTMECFMLQVKTIPLPRFFMKTKATRMIYESYRKWILRKYKMTEKLIPNSVIRDGFCGVQRDKDYEHAKNYQLREVLKIEGSLVWCKMSGEWIIGDLDLASGNFEQLINKMKSIAAKLGLRQIQFHTSPGTHLHSLFTARFSAIPSFPVLFQQLDPAVNIGNIKFTLADIDIF